LASIGHIFSKRQKGLDAQARFKMAGADEPPTSIRTVSGSEASPSFFQVKAFTQTLYYVNGSSPLMVDETMGVTWADL